MSNIQPQGQKQQYGVYAENQSKEEVPIQPQGLQGSESAQPLKQQQGLQGLQAQQAERSQLGKHSIGQKNVMGTGTHNPSYNDPQGHQKQK